MSLRSCVVYGIIGLIAFGGGNVSRAQLTAGPGKVSGTGTVAIKRRPDVLRMQVQLAAQGKDVKDALAKLKARRDAVKAKLLEIGANKDTITTGDPGAAVEDSSRRQQMEMMVRERMRQQGRRAPKKEEAKPVNLSMELKAEWPLAGDDAEQVFVVAYELQKKVAAELAKLKGAEDVSPEEEEMAEEMAQSMGGYDDGQPKPGEPIFLYVSRIPQEELDKALTEAFGKAKAHAAQLSQIAGAKLGPLEHLVSHQTAANMENQYGGYRGNPYLYRAMMQMEQQDPSTPSENPREALGADPSHVSLSVSVVAAFGFAE